MTTCDTRALLCPAFLTAGDSHLIAICERVTHIDVHTVDPNHEGRTHDVAAADAAADPQPSGSPTVVSWHEGDRRTYRGDLRVCALNPDGRRCVLPANHAGRCAT